MLHPRKKQILDIFGKEPETLDELGHCIFTVANYFSTQLDGLAWNIEYKPNISNTHNCPINGECNFSRHPDQPLYYSGFAGRVWLRVSKSCKESFSSDILGGSLVRTGTGGAGSYNGPWNHFETANGLPKTRLASYGQFNIFLDDWPIINEWVEHRALFDIIQEKSLKINHTFFWESDEIMQYDKQIIGEEHYNQSLMRRTTLSKYKNEEYNEIIL